MVHERVQPDVPPVNTRAGSGVGNRGDWTVARCLRIPPPCRRSCGALNPGARVTERTASGVAPRGAAAPHPPAPTTRVRQHL